jgi:hypothetical protein
MEVFDMKLGTVVYDGKIYNLDYMNTAEVKELLKKVEKQKASEFSQGKQITKRTRA